MFLAFDLPVEGCAHLNDREAVLARLANGDVRSTCRTTSPDRWHLLHPRIEKVLAIVTPEFTEQDPGRLRDWFFVGEYAFGVDLLVRLLLFDRVPLDDSTHALVTSILDGAGPVFQEDVTFLSAPATVTRLFDRVGEPLRRRGMPPLRGGLEAPPFPAGWPPRQAADEVFARSPEPVVRLPNDRHWRTSRVDGIPVGVLSTPGGEIRATLPGAPHRPPAPFADPAHATTAELLAYCVRANTTRLLRVVHPDPDEAAVLAALHLAGEYDELGDALVARADHEWPRLDRTGRHHAVALLRSYDRPVAGCPQLGDEVLTRWTAGR